MEEGLANLANMAAQFRRTTLMFTSCVMSCQVMMPKENCSNFTLLTTRSVDYLEKLGLDFWGDIVAELFCVYIIYTVRMQTRRRICICNLG